MRCTDSTYSLWKMRERTFLFGRSGLTILDGRSAGRSQVIDCTTDPTSSSIEIDQRHEEEKKFGERFPDKLSVEEIERDVSCYRFLGVCVSHLEQSGEKRWVSEIERGMRFLRSVGSFIKKLAPDSLAMIQEEQEIGQFGKAEHLLPSQERIPSESSELSLPPCWLLAYAPP